MAPHIFSRRNVTEHSGVARAGARPFQAALVVIVAGIGTSGKPSSTSRAIAARRALTNRCTVCPYPGLTVRDQGRTAAPAPPPPAATAARPAMRRSARAPRPAARVAPAACAGHSGGGASDAALLPTKPLSSLSQIGSGPPALGRHPARARSPACPTRPEPPASWPGAAPSRRRPAAPATARWRLLRGLRVFLPAIRAVMADTGHEGCRPARHLR